MLHEEALGLFIGAIVLGGIHGIEPGHGWPVAASYALERGNKWAYGFAASFILGIGHLVSSIAMVAVFFYAKAYFNLTQVNDPITILGGIQIGGPVSLVAGVLLIVLGIREYRHGHSHGDHRREQTHGEGSAHEFEDQHVHSHNQRESHRHGHHEPDDHIHSDSQRGHQHSHDGVGLLTRIGRFIPFVSGELHNPDPRSEAAERGLFGIAWFAFLLGFAHEEEFEIIALCAGSNHCLELMSAYAITVIIVLVGMTMLLIAGYHRYEARVERYTPYLPTFAAAVLILMGLGFITGLF